MVESNDTGTNDRYTSMRLIYGNDLFEFMRQSRVLVVGAGGIGCELLKNLVLTGFENIDIIDLDTIDVSNLNRQFLFRQEHVGEAKSLMAKNAALKFNPNCKINAHHGNIKNAQFGPQWFKNFSIVMNALDNVDARRHVNRMCLAANVVMLDGGTAGYLGQVKSYQKGFSECYECYQKPTQKTFAVCTIRSNPSTPVHCIVWAKLLFERLFGKVDDSNAVSDFESLKQLSNVDEFAQSVFDKVYSNDIKELTVMKNKEVWNTGRPPEPIDALFIEKHGDSTVTDHKDAASSSSSSSSTTNGNGIGGTEGSLHTHHHHHHHQSDSSSMLKDQKILTLNENLQLFLSVTKQLRQLREKLGCELSFDKDDDLALDFVASAANLRAFNFHIALKSRFDVKAIAGNIVPAIATTNAVIAGFLVTEGIKVFRSMFENRNADNNGTPVNHVSQCVEIELRRTTAKKNRKDCYVMSVPQRPPNPNCYVCTSNFLSLECNVDATTLDYFVKEILQKRLALLEPTITIGYDIVYESGEGLEEDEIQAFQAKLPKSLTQLKILDQTSVSVEDFLQDVNWKITIVHNAQLDIDEFKIIGKTEAAPTTAPSESAALEKPVQDGEDNDDILDDMIMLDDYGKEPEQPTKATTTSARKRKRAATEDEDQNEPAKKQKPSSDAEVISLD